ncbi:flagellar hook-basal body protein FliE [Gracilibacillus halophilus YIM-C55.5]|uniref:Flagellar hook-basal body complex protein FliE n=1 Tax=Gracilibacillus halophilus YIM-C55.5 TaxID=1308866 RepID=N4WD71_9BACI|nr:flagellar hook-basal body complex protein FliE [Gracilibacillus halophilus]ENH98243.1 flagellar hook-basal body protein FliE [Gracilibacillus halophilus YIM-C55.5]
MNIDSITQMANTNPTQQKQQDITVGEAQQSFANSLKNAIDQVNQAQQASNQKTEALAKGDIDNLHDVMVTAQKASITLQTGVEIQKKVVDAYNEVMRMQV